jgi:hypothetical protein
MKAISLWQPWASFIAIGVKPFETRDWAPPLWLIGQRIAIHAAKKAVEPDDREWARLAGASELPLGAIVCTAVLAGAYQCGANLKEKPWHCRVAERRGLATPERATIKVDEFGDYDPGRWAWWLTDIEPAIPARGSQGLWDWPGELAHG